MRSPTIGKVNGYFLLENGERVDAKGNPAKYKAWRGNGGYLHQQLKLQGKAE